MVSYCAIFLIGWVEQMTQFLCICKHLDFFHRSSVYLQTLLKVAIAKLLQITEVQIIAGSKD